MGLWSSFEKGIRQKYHRDIRGIYQGDIKGERKMVVLRIPINLHKEVKGICEKNGLSFNDGTILLYKYLSEQRLEFEIVKRVRARRRG